jgi:hypothetical protein
LIHHGKPGQCTFEPAPSARGTLVAAWNGSVCSREARRRLPQRKAESFPMLFFELFPAFMAVVALVVGIGLFVMDRQAVRDSGSGVRDPRNPQARR